MFEHHFDRIYRTLHTILSNQEKIMANQADLDASAANLQTQLDALIAKVGVPSVPEAALDELKAKIDAMASAAQQAANA